MPTETTVTTKKVAKKVVPSKTAENTVTALTVASTEHEPANRPESFEALKLRELQAAAEAFGVDWEGESEEVIRANLAADYITWPMYVKQFKLPGWDQLPSGDAEDFPEPLDDWDEKEEEEVTQEVITASPLALQPDGKFLIKFIGQNWYFERGRYTFTKDKPYALMSARDAQSALVDEPSKFRQAMPQELEDFYS